MTTLTLLLMMTVHNASGVKVEANRISIKRSADPREIARGFLRRAIPDENIDDVVKATTRRKHFEKHFASGAFVTLDDDDGWLVIYVGHNDGPRLGISFTPYKIKVE